MGLIGVGCGVMRMMRAVIIKNPARFAPHENNFSGILMKFRAVAFVGAKMRHKCLIYASTKTLIFLSFLHCFERFLTRLDSSINMTNTSLTPVRSNIASNPKTGHKKNQKQAGLPNKLKGFIFNETNAACLLCGGEHLPLSHADAQTDDQCARVFQVTQTIKLPDHTVYDLMGKDLNIDQMHLLRKVFGAKGAGSMNKFACCKSLAMRKSLGHQYGVGKIVDLKDNDA